MTEQQPGPDAYTSWFTRVVAWLIDYLPLIVISGIASALLAVTKTTSCIADASEYEIGALCETQYSTIGLMVAVLTGLLSLGYLVWNLGYRQGTTGSSLGKSVMKFQVISESTGRPIGFGLSCVREVLYLAASGCGLLWLIAVLFPLWDAKRQTLADKIMSTICIPLSPRYPVHP
jgi:uncharacterized RDD family membrane protein YckC